MGQCSASCARGKGSDLGLSVGNGCYNRVAVWGEKEAALPGWSSGKKPPKPETKGTDRAVNVN